MPFNGAGAFSVYTPGNPVVTGTTISSTVNNNTNSDFATGLSSCLLKDGTQTVTANIPMSGFKLTGLGAGSAAGNSLRYEQLFTSGLVTLLGTFTGPTTLGVGAATPAATGAGVTFPATASASSDANTLDDYQEASFTITLTGVSGTVTGTATYTKIGNSVTLNVPNIQGTSNATTKTLTGLPAELIPATVKNAAVIVSDNGGNNGVSYASMAAVSGTITVLRDAAGTNWTASGTATVNAFQIAYTLA